MMLLVLFSHIRVPTHNPLEPSVHRERAGPIQLGGLQARAQCSITPNMGCTPAGEVLLLAGAR